MYQHSGTEGFTDVTFCLNENVRLGSLLLLVFFPALGTGAHVRRLPNKRIGGNYDDGTSVPCVRARGLSLKPRGRDPASAFLSTGYFTAVMKSQVRAAGRRRDASALDRQTFQFHSDGDIFSLSIFLLIVIWEVKPQGVWFNKTRYTRWNTEQTRLQTE